MHFQKLSNGNFGEICSELCSPRRHRGRSGVCFFARSWSPDRAKWKFTLRSLCLCGKNSFGFTLMEILVAMFIFAIVLSTIYTSYTGTFRIVNETESQADIYAMARVAFERMQEDLESVYIPLKNEKSPESDEWQADDKEGAFVGEDNEKSPESDEWQADDKEGAFVGEDNEIEGRSNDSLRFISRAHLVFSEQEQRYGTAEIAYDVKKDYEGKGLVLYRTDTPTFQEQPEEGTGGLVLCDNLVSLNLTYYDDEGEVYDNWDSTSDEFNNKIPKMVSIILEFENIADPEMPFTFMTSVALPISQG